jgi:TolA-binding protein
MDPVAAASVLVSIVAAASAYASQRSANKASTKNTSVSLEAKRLEQAYERARKFDMKTIERQDQLIRDLTAKVEHLEERNDELEAQVLALEIQVGRKQQGG